MAMRAARFGTLLNRAATSMRPLAGGLSAISVRCLDLHEADSKEIMAKYGVRVQRGYLAHTPEEAREVGWDLKGECHCRELVIKSQILAGGRGKGHFLENNFKGGVKVVERPEDIEIIAAKMLGNTLVTNQTGPKGQKVSKVLVHEAIDFDHEFYLAFILDRSVGGAAMVGSPMGGMDIEAVAESHPDKIYTTPIDGTVTTAQARDMCQKLGVPATAMNDAIEQIQNLYKLFKGEEAVQVEINPFVVTRDVKTANFLDEEQRPHDPCYEPGPVKHGKIYCVDAKIGFDDNAAFRHADTFARRDESMDDPREVEADKYALNYIGLDGQIGCMVNGAGLAMATMDIIALHGGSAANFLDVGGGADEKQVENAFRILSNDPKVKAILVNIFGGIMKCDIIANGIVAAAKNIKLDLPLVVRLEGTNVEIGKKILEQSGIKVLTADDLDDAAKKAVASLTA